VRGCGLRVTEPQCGPGSGKKRIGGCCIKIRAGISVRVRDGVRISDRVRRRVKLVNYSLITALPIATSANPLFTRGRVGQCPLLTYLSSDKMPALALKSAH